MSHSTMTVVTEADVKREGNIRVVLPWDGRIGEIWDDGMHEHGHGIWEQMYGIAGLGEGPVPSQTFWQQSWEDLEQMYSWRGATILRAPAGAEPGDLLEYWLEREHAAAVTA